MADRLTGTAQRLSALAGVLARLRDGATWDGPAGDAFGARLREVAPVLDAVATRLGGSSAPLRALADAMAEAQVVVGAAVLDLDESEHAYLVLEDRAVALCAAGRPDDDPDLLVVRHLQVEQVEVQQGARARHAAAAERFREADARCAAILRSLTLDGLADGLPYRVLVGLSGAGQAVASLEPLATVVPELKPVVAVAAPVAVAADTALLVAYGEGDGRQLATDAALAATGALGGVLRNGATLGARRTADGVVSTSRLTAAQRVARGAVQEARARRDALRASFRVPPARGTASSLVGGPAPRSPAGGGSGAGLTIPAMTVQLRSGARRAALGVNTAVRQRADRAFLDDWRLATANGPQAQRMYAAGTTLLVTSKTLKPRTETTEGGGNVR
ncbi:MAG: hypothetical protein ACJ714_15675 [Ornithinibacter sp.]